MTATAAELARFFLVTPVVAQRYIDDPSQAPSAIRHWIEGRTSNAGPPGPEAAPETGDTAPADEPGPDDTDAADVL